MLPQILPIKSSVLKPLLPHYSVNSRSLNGQSGTSCSGLAYYIYAKSCGTLAPAGSCSTPLPPQRLHPTTILPLLYNDHGSTSISSCDSHSLTGYSHAKQLCSKPRPHRTLGAMAPLKCIIITITPCAQDDADLHAAGLYSLACSS